VLPGPLALAALDQRPVLIAVDFIQMVADRVETSRADWAHFGKAAKRLKLIAEKFGVQVLAASQLNRASEYEKRPPALADFSLSDQTVQFADPVAHHRTGSALIVLRTNSASISRITPCARTSDSARMISPRNCAAQEKAARQFRAAMQAAAILVLT